MLAFGFLCFIQSPTTPVREQRKGKNEHEGRRETNKGKRRDILVISYCIDRALNNTTHVYCTLNPYISKGLCHYWPSHSLNHVTVSGVL